MKNNQINLKKTLTDSDNNLTKNGEKGNETKIDSTKRRENFVTLQNYRTSYMRCEMD